MTKVVFCFEPVACGIDQLQTIRLWIVCFQLVCCEKEPRFTVMLSCTKTKVGGVFPDIRGHAQESLEIFIDNFPKFAT